MQNESIIDQTTSKSGDDVITFPVDPEPFGFRLTLVIALGISMVVGYTLFNLIFASSGLNILACLGGIAFGAGILQVVERVLKRYWKSNRVVALSQERIAILASDVPHIEIDPKQQVNVHTWYFDITKRARAPKGWHVVAIALEQDDIYLPIYALMSPDDYKAMNRNFTKLKSKTMVGVEDRDLRLAGQQRRLHTAETARGIDGSEILKTDFDRFISQLEIQYPNWMPKTRS